MSDETSQSNSESESNEIPGAKPNKEVPVKLPPQVISYIKTLPEEEQKVVKAMFIAMSIKQSSFRSPIPPPDILKGYNEIIPNGADRILTMTEDQSKHRMILESSVITEQQRQGSKGQNFGFILGLVGILATIFLAYTGHDGVAGVFGTTTIVGLAGVFVIGKYQQSKDSDNKKES